MAEGPGSTPIGPPALESMHKRGIGVMPSQPRNMPEQEHSIKVRSKELYVEVTPEAPLKTTKPFPVYLRETPAQPLSSGIRAIFWVLGLIVALLFLAALWRIVHRQALKRPAGETDIKTARMVGPDIGQGRSELATAPGRGRPG